MLSALSLVYTSTIRFTLLCYRATVATPPHAQPWDRRRIPAEQGLTYARQSVWAPLALGQFERRICIWPEFASSSLRMRLRLAETRDFGLAGGELPSRRKSAWRHSQHDRGKLPTSNRLVLHGGKMSPPFLCDVWNTSVLTRCEVCFKDAIAQWESRR